MSWEPPYIQTDVWGHYTTTETARDPFAQSIQNAEVAFVAVPREPTYMEGRNQGGPQTSTNGITPSDGVEYTYGISLGHYDPQIMHWWRQMQAPPIPVSPLPYSSQLRNAANPVPTYSQVGFHGQLRAPGINEGYQS